MTIPPFSGNSKTIATTTTKWNVIYSMTGFGPVQPEVGGIGRVEYCQHVKVPSQSIYTCFGLHFTQTRSECYLLSCFGTDFTLLLSSFLAWVVSPMRSPKTQYDVFSAWGYLQTFATFLPGPVKHTPNFILHVSGTSWYSHCRDMFKYICKNFFPIASLAMGYHDPVSKEKHLTVKSITKVQ